MAKRGSTSTAANSFGGYKFINISLGQAEKEELEELLSRSVFDLSLVFDLVQDGFKVSFSEDPEHHSFICSFTDTRKGSPTEKYILTGRGSSPVASFYAAYYKHVSVAGGNWVQYIERDNTKSSTFG